MKNITLAIIALGSLTASAHMIEGTQVLKGTIKTKIIVNSVKTTCRAKVEKVKNLMLEDTFGNPAYNVRVDMGLDGNDFERNLSVKFDKEFWLNNLFTVANGTEVRDFEYASKDGATMNIDRTGRIRKVTFLYQNKQITCTF